MKIWDFFAFFRFAIRNGPRTHDEPIIEHCLPTSYASHYIHISSGQTKTSWNFIEIENLTFLMLKQNRITIRENQEKEEELYGRSWKLNIKKKKEMLLVMQRKETRRKEEVNVCQRDGLSGFNCFLPCSGMSEDCGS